MSHMLGAALPGCRVAPMASMLMMDSGCEALASALLSKGRGWSGPGPVGDPGCSLQCEPASWGGGVPPVSALPACKYNLLPTPTCSIRAFDHPGSAVLLLGFSPHLHLFSQNSKLPGRKKVLVAA